VYVGVSGTMDHSHSGVSLAFCNVYSVASLHSSEEQRSTDYEDWNLNGDIMVQHPLTNYRHELSSKGIRVDKESLLKQLEHKDTMHEAELSYQQAVINGSLPFSYGGGIGISRLLMLLLRTCHIGEVQVGLWHDDHYKQAIASGIDMISDRILTIPATAPATAESDLRP
jgi:asparagine synthetase A